MAELPDGSSVTRVFVSGLPPSMTKDQLRSHFATKFTITDAHIVQDRRIGFVGFSDHESAKKAAKWFDRTFVKMSKISVNLAKPVEVRRDVSGQAAPVSQRYGGRRREAVDVPSNKRKREAHDDGENARDESFSLPRDKNAHDVNEEENALQDIAMKVDQEETKAEMGDEPKDKNIQTSDSDWLRGKTSRLLDLVEERDNAVNSKSLPISTGFIEPARLEPGPPDTRDSKSDDEPLDLAQDAGSISIPNARLFIRNLPFSTSDESLRDTFAPYGRISEVSHNFLFSVMIRLRDDFLIGTAYAEGI